MIGPAFDPATVQVGSTVWIDDPYEGSRRWLECRVTIVGTRYWTAAYRGSALRFPKAPEPKGDPRVRYALRSYGGHPAVYLTREAVEDARWLATHRHPLHAKVGTCSDVATLREIARLLGYDAP